MKERPSRKQPKPAPAGNEPERTVRCSRKVSVEARLSVRQPGLAPIRVELRTSNGSRLLSWVEASPPASTTYTNSSLFAPNCDTVAVHALGGATPAYVCDVNFQTQDGPANGTRTVITDTAPGIFTVTVTNKAVGAPVTIRLDGTFGTPVRSVTVPPDSTFTIRAKANRAQIIPASGIPHGYQWSASINPA